MNSKQRFLAALQHQPVDRVPLFDFLFQRPLFTEFIGRTPQAYNARDAMDLTLALGLDAVWIPYGCFSGWSPAMIGANQYRDEWGTTFQQDQASWPIDAPIAYPIQTRKDLQSYCAPDPQAAGRLKEVETAVAVNTALGDRAVAICGGVTGPLTLMWMLTGYENICLALYDDPEFLKQLARLAVDFAAVAVTRMAAAGVDGVFVSEDLGCSAGGLLSREHFRAIVKPPLREICAHIRGQGLPVILHSCGRIYDYLDDLAELDIDAVHPLQRTAGMDLAVVKRRYGRRFCLFGNIDSSRTLPFGTPDEVEQEVREAIAIAAPGGGYVLGSDHSLHDGIPVKNIVRMFEVARGLALLPGESKKGVSE
ncbi:MAG: uroporphyrinogen decarboxylase family protein [Kiritimatiellae bacterium]|nr:uroporphyrinogen decarboxylase family protein [Kiritimatiellia bacterium]